MARGNKLLLTAVTVSLLMAASCEDENKPKNPNPSQQQLSYPSLFLIMNQAKNNEEADRLRRQQDEALNKEGCQPSGGRFCSR